MASTLGAHNPLRYRGYVYDHETGLYYLQSRYYDPDVGRFINADSLIDTDSIIGHNLFVYCWNNPVNMGDSTGKSPYTILNISDYRIIHNRVQMECKSQKGWSLEVAVSGSLGKGRLDLYDSDSHVYYEVKSIGASQTKATRKQMEKYDVAKVTDKRFKDSQYSNKKVKRGRELVSGGFSYGIYDVDFHLEKSGLIVYSVKLNQRRAATYLSCVLGVAVASGFVFATGGVALPALAPVFLF